MLLEGNGVEDKNKEYLKGAGASTQLKRAYVKMIMDTGTNMCVDSNDKQVKSIL